MNNETSPHPFDWDKLRLWVVTVAAPIVGLLITALIFIIKLASNSENWHSEQIITNGRFENRLDKIENKVDGQSKDIDTLSRRQLQYHYENKIYQASQQKK